MSSMAKKFKTPGQYNAAQNKKRGKNTHPMNMFARNSKSGHPAYVYHKLGHNYFNIGITHDSADGQNILLNVNPEPGNTSEAYIKSNPEIGRDKNFNEKLPDWKFDATDLPKVEAVKQKSPKKHK